jgi:Flp pilus assembly protein TadD
MDVEELLQRALALAEESRWDEMAEILRLALEEHEADPYLLCWLGVAERELDLSGVAYERFKACLGLRPQDPRVLSLAGEALADFDDPEAEGALRAASVLGPNLPDVRLAYGAYLAREGLFEEAFQELDAARELDPDNPTVALERGVAFALSERMEEAANEFSRSVELDPQDGWARVLLGLSLVETDALEEGAVELVEGARARPDDLEAHVLAALAAEAAGWEDLAYEMLERGREVALPGDLGELVEAEDRLNAGPRFALGFLRDSMMPLAFHARLMARS